MHLAICDDNQQELRQIAAAAENFSRSRAESSRTPISISSFNNAEEMLRAAQQAHFTHYLLDVSMPCMDGLTAAQEIRLFDEEAKIVFLTSYREYAYQSYRVHAFDYLLKPVQTELLQDLFERLIALEENAERYICLSSGRGFVRIALSQISHLEVSQKRLHFHMTDGQVRQIPGTMAEAEKELLSNPEFSKIHRSYIVNLNHVSALSPGGCIMLSGQNLPISRLLFNQVKQAYIVHLFGGKEV